MKLEKEDYIEPNCVLCGKPGEEAAAEPVPVGRILDKLREYEDRNDWEGVERHLKYWLAEAETNRSFLSCGPRDGTDQETRDGGHGYRGDNLGECRHGPGGFR